MKKIFSKRSGFTLVEVLVAFAVFAIMAAMVAQILSITLAQRRSNNDFEDQLEQDAAYYASKNKDYTYGSKDGTVSLDFGSVSLDFDYSVKGMDSSDEYKGVNYFVGYGLDYAATGDLGGGAGGAGGSGGSITNRLDSRIYGSTYFSEIRIYYCEKDTTYNEPGQSRYIFVTESKNESGKVDSNTSGYRQYRLSFPNSVLNCGYVNAFEYKSGGPTANRIPSSSGVPSDQINEVMVSSDNSIRIGVPVASFSKTGSVAGKISYFYVTFEGDPQLDRSSFGDNGTLSGDYYSYKKYVEGSTTYLNIYGAYVKGG